MDDVMRLDRLLAMLGEGTRAQVRALVRAGRVTVDGEVARDAGMRVNALAARVFVDERPLSFKRAHHLMMNKPANVLTAARDAKQKTVMDLLPPHYAAIGCMPVGRLDKDTEGLLLFTDDGQLSHRLISPRHDVGKTYFARVDGPLCEADVRAFAEGLYIDDGDGAFLAKPAKLEILSAFEGQSEARVRVSEGKYHQVRRMFAARGLKVTALKRLAIGGLWLDAALAPGAWRELTDAEVALLEQADERGMP